MTSRRDASEGGSTLDRSSWRATLVAWMPAMLHMALIWTASSFPTVPLDVNQFPLRDKGVHFLVYSVLGALVARAFERTRPRWSAAHTALVAAGFALGWGASDELHQAFVPGRMPSWLDLLADGLGGGFGACLWVWGLARIGRQR